MLQNIFSKKYFVLLCDTKYFFEKYFLKNIFRVESYYIVIQITLEAIVTLFAIPNTK